MRPIATHNTRDLEGPIHNSVEDLNSGTYLTFPGTGEAEAKPLLRRTLRFAAVNALRRAVLNNLGRTMTIICN